MYTLVVLLWNMTCIVTVVLKNKFNFTSVVIRSKRSKISSCSSPDSFTFFLHLISFPVLIHHVVCTKSKFKIDLQKKLLHGMPVADHVKVLVEFLFFFLITYANSPISCRITWSKCFFHSESHVTQWKICSHKYFASKVW